MAEYLLTPSQAAERLGICTRTLRGLVSDGELPFIFTGRGLQRKLRMFHPDDIAAFVEARREHNVDP